MMNFVETRDMTATKIKNEARSILMEDIAAFLKEKYGEDNVGMVRIGSGLSKKNVLAVRTGEVEFEDGSNDLTLKVEISATDYCERVTKSKTFPAFDFDEARTAYDTYLAEKAESKKAKSIELKED